MEALPFNHNGGPPLEPPPPSPWRRGGKCAACRHWKAPGKPRIEAYESFQRGASKVRVAEPAGYCHNVRYSRAGGVASAATKGRSCCWNFEAKPEPAHKPGTGGGFTTIYQGSRIVWKGWSEDVPPRFREKPKVRRSAKRRAAVANAMARLDLRAWLDQVDHLNRIMRPRTKLYDRFDRHARRLTPAAIRACADAEAVAAVERRLRGARNWDGHGLHDLNRVWSRQELGRLIVEATNRARQLAAGDRRREKGPAFDPRRIPDDRLEILIQRHQDLAVVEALRAERERRSHLRRAA